MLLVFEFFIRKLNTYLKFFFTLFFFCIKELITSKVIKGLYNGVTTIEINNLVAETAASMTTTHPDYALLAGRLAVSALHKETKDKFSGKKKNKFYDK